MSLKIPASRKSQSGLCRIWHNLKVIMSYVTYLENDYVVCDIIKIWKCRMWHNEKAIVSYVTYFRETDYVVYDIIEKTLCRMWHNYDSSTWCSRHICREQNGFMLILIGFDTILGVFEVILIDMEKETREWVSFYRRKLFSCLFFFLLGGFSFSF